MTLVKSGEPRQIVMARTPLKTREAEAAVRWLLTQQKPELHEEGAPLEVSVVFVLRRPRAAKRRSWPVVKPDLDNLLKLVGDAGTGYVWPDDKQIVRAVVEKRYAVGTEPPHMEICVRRLPN